MHSERRAHVDAALEYALERAIADRPTKPLVHVADKLRKWDEAVLGDWRLKKRAQNIFERADADGSGFLDLAELTAMKNSPEFGEAMLSIIDADSGGQIELNEWLIYVKANETADFEVASKMLDMFENWLDGKLPSQEAEA